MPAKSGKLDTAANAVANIKPPPGGLRKIRVLGVPLDLGQAAAASTWAPPRCALPDWKRGSKPSATR